MTIFKSFPLTTYEFNSQESVVKDILIRSKFVSEYRPYSDILTPYSILDGDTPQSLAKTLYGAATFHWIILLSNEIHDPYFEWPISSLDLENLCINKYGSEVMNMTRHHERDGLVVGEIKVFLKGIPWVPPVSAGESFAVSFYDYEERINDSKREIGLLRPELLTEFTKQFKDSLNV